MLRTISASDLQAQIKQVLNDVGYGQAQYIVEKFGEPTAAIVSIEDFYLLQAARQERASASFRDLVSDMRERGREVDPGELNRLIELYLSPASLPPPTCQPADSPTC